MDPPTYNPGIVRKPAPIVNTYQDLEWESAKNNIKYKDSYTFTVHIPRPHFPRSARGGGGVGATSHYKGEILPEPSSKQSLSEKFNNKFPRERRYCGLKRRTFFICLIAAFVALLVFVIGLAVGLSQRSAKALNLPLPNNSEVHTGDWTYYAPGLGACGITSTDSDMIVAISHLLWDSQQVGSNPNSNPFCGKKIRATRWNEAIGAERSVDLTVVDRCTGCKPTDLDTSTAAFDKLAPHDKGRVVVKWAWLV